MELKYSIAHSIFVESAREASTKNLGHEILKHYGVRIWEGESRGTLFVHHESRYALFEIQNQHDGSFEKNLDR